MQIGGPPVAAHDHSHGPGDQHHHDHEHHAGHDHHHGPTATAATKPRSLLDRLTAIADIALGDFIDIMAFLVIGAALAAFVRNIITQSVFEQLAAYPHFLIAGMMCLAIALALCSEADAFVAANIGVQSVGAKLAFLVLGPMLDVKLYIMYRWVFTPKAVRVIVATLLIMVFTTTYLADSFLTAMTKTKAALGK